LDAVSCTATIITISPYPCGLRDEKLIYQCYTVFIQVMWLEKREEDKKKIHASQPAGQAEAAEEEQLRLYERYLQDQEWARERAREMAEEWREEERRIWRKILRGLEEAGILPPPLEPPREGG
jgi:hypothetical protein